MRLKLIAVIVRDDVIAVVHCEMPDQTSCAKTRRKEKKTGFGCGQYPESNSSRCSLGLFSTFILFFGFVRKSHTNTPAASSYRTTKGENFSFHYRSRTYAASKSLCYTMKIIELDGKMIWFGKWLFIHFQIKGEGWKGPPEKEKKSSL